jgi:hypothetical protein
VSPGNKHLIHGSKHAVRRSKHTFLLDKHVFPGNKHTAQGTKHVENGGKHVLPSRRHSAHEVKYLILRQDFFLAWHLFLPEYIKSGIAINAIIWNNRIVPGM